MGRGATERTGAEAGHRTKRQHPARSARYATTIRYSRPFVANRSPPMLCMISLLLGCFDLCLSVTWPDKARALERGPQDRHPVDDPAEYPDLRADHGERHLDFHPGRHVPRRGVPLEADHRHVETIQ